MIEQQITYTDVMNSTEVTEKFLFHLSETDLMSIEASYEEGLEAEAARIVEKEDKPAIMLFVSNLLTKSFGYTTKINGRELFVKDLTSEEYLYFRYGGAYDHLFMGLLSGEIDLASFISGILPKIVQDAVKDQVSHQSN